MGDIPQEFGFCNVEGVVELLGSSDGGEDLREPVLEGLGEKPVGFVDYLQFFRRQKEGAKKGEAAYQEAKVLEREVGRSEQMIHQPSRRANQDIHFTRPTKQAEVRVMMSERGFNKED